jgi:hypothetical protein
MEGSPRSRPYRRFVGFSSAKDRTSAAQVTPFPRLLSGLSNSGLLLFLLVIFAGSSPNIARSGQSDTGKGPIGWDSYRRLDLFPQLRSGTETRDFSSTDPAQANGDFNHPLRVTSDGQYVIAEANGPGEIVSIWSTINGGDVTNDGLITIELDGNIVLSTNYQALVSGALGAPWVWPLVGNLYDTSGGAQIKVPMPYTQSMRVTVQGNPDYFHVI